MKPAFITNVLLVFIMVTAEAATPTYSTGGVDAYMPCGFPNLPWRVSSADAVAGWFNLAGFPAFSNWRNGDVWGNDFRNAGSPNDRDPGGGSDVPQIYLYAGHGTCQDPPGPTDPDFITPCGNIGGLDFDDIGANDKWGSQSGGSLQFLFLEASCPMDLISIGNNWFPVFRGLHVATGHSGTSTHDTYDSAQRPANFAVYTVGGGRIDLPFPFGVSLPLILYPPLSVGDAWMATGLQDVDESVCAVAIAAGETEADAVDRRENERLTDGRSDPIPNWFGWRWVCN